MASSTDTRKYIVGRTDFRRLPRWPNDGIEQYRNLPVEDSVEVGVARDPDQMSLTELCGSWRYRPLHELDANSKQGILSHPYYMQLQAAEKLFEEQAALDHLVKAYRQRDPEFMKLIKKINCRNAIRKTAKNIKRFPGFVAILIPLFDKKLASDENVILLFGDVMRVMHLLIEIGANIAEPPHPTSPAAQVMAPYRGLKIEPAPKECENCGTTDAELLKCAGCTSVAYCSQDCQSADWLIHKPDCLELQGKPVSQAVKSKAGELLVDRENENLEREKEEKRLQKKRIQRAIETFENEDPSMVETWSIDQFRRRRRVHLPELLDAAEARAAAEADLQVDQELFLKCRPEGIPHDNSGLGRLFNCPDTGAKLALLHEELYDIGRGGVLNGHSIEGIFVVDSIVSDGEVRGEKAIWCKVEEPIYSSGMNRFQRLVQHLLAAKNQAKAAPENMCLIHSSPPPQKRAVPGINPYC